MKILLVEDDKIAMMILRTMVGKLGHTPVCCIDGEEAVECIDTSVDLIITDWMLPIISGVELISMIKAKIGRNPPILLMSAMPEKVLIDKAASIGAHGVLPKPYTIELLNAKILQFAN